jgi:PAS domain S-box-containing protein
MEGSEMSSPVPPQDSFDRQRIDELERENKAIKKKLAQFEAVYDHHFQMTGLIDTDGRLLMGNRTAFEFAGIEAQDVVGKLFWETPWWTHSKEQQRRLREEMKKALRGEMAHFESTHVSANGDLRIVDFRIRPVFDADNEVIYLVPEGYDITESKRAEESLHRQAEFDAIIAGILARFARSSASEINDSIAVCLEEIGLFVHAESAYIISINFEQSTWSADHNWVAPDTPDLISDYQKIPLGTLPWTESNILAGQIVCISSLNDYPPEADAERQTFERDKAKSELLVPLRDLNGRVSGNIGFRTYEYEMNWIPEDISRIKLVGEAIANVLERKRAEESLQLSEERYRGLVNTMQDIVYSLSVDGTFLFIGPQVDRYGYTDEELVSQPFVEFIHPEDRVAVMREFEHTIETGEQIIINFRVATTDDRVIWLEEIGQAVYDENGEIVSISGMLRDISKRKEAEEALRESEEKYRTFFKNSCDAMFMIRNGVFIDCNNAAVNLLGYREASELLGRGPTDISPEYQSDGLKSTEKSDEMIKIAFAQGTHRFEWEHCKADEGSAPVDVSLTAMYDQDEPLMLAVWRDTSDRKKVEEEREKLELQLRQAQKMEAVGQLAGGVAHDFNNVLTAIIGYGELALFQAEPNSPSQEYLDEVLKAGNRAAVLVRQLLAFSRKQVLKLEILDLNNVVEDLVKMIHRLLGAHIALTIDAEPTEIMVHADRGQIEQILMNLCVNARDAMPEGGRLMVEMKRRELDADFCESQLWAKPGSYAFLNVRDTGSGIDEETLLRIFEPFFTTKEEGKGTGLGLATVYGIVRQHNGLIHVESEVGQGTEFQIYLPLSETAADITLETELQSPPGGTEVILLAEDDMMVNDLARRILEKAGYTVLVSSNGSEAISVFERYKERVELALLDVVMPDGGGREVFNHIRKAGSQIPILFASGYSPSGIHVNFVLEEGMELIQKPYKQAQLLIEVRRLLDV